MYQLSELLNLGHLLEKIERDLQKTFALNVEKTVPSEYPLRKKLRLPRTLLPKHATIVPRVHAKTPLGITPFQGIRLR